LAFIYYLHDLAFSGFKKRSLILSTFFLILTGMPHILDFFVALLFFAIYTVLVLIFNVNRASFMKAVGIITLIISAFIFIATTFFGSLFKDFNSVFSLIRDLIVSPVTVSGEAKAIPSSLGFGPIQADPQPLSNGVDLIGGWGIILLIISLGIILSFYTWKKKQKEALLLLIAATTISLVICFPLLPSEVLFRTSLMMFIPATIILSYGISEIWKSNYRNSKIIAMIVLVICLSLFVAQSFRVLTSIHPAISDDGYLDLVNMKSQIPANSIVFTEHGLHYWVKYVDEVEVVETTEISPELWKSYSHVLVIISKDKAPPQISHEVIFVGKALLLAEVQ